MAHSLSAKKRVRQNAKLRVINRQRKSALKTQTRKFMDALSTKDVNLAEQEFRKLTKNLAQVAAAGTIHANNASRRKSRLQTRLNALKGAT